MDSRGCPRPRRRCVCIRIFQELFEWYLETGNGVVRAAARTGFQRHSAGRGGDLTGRAKDRFYRNLGGRKEHALHPQPRFDGSKTSAGIRECVRAILVPGQPFNSLRLKREAQALRSDWHEQQVLCDSARLVGGTWGKDGIIIFGPDYDKDLLQVSAKGGEPTPLNTAEPVRSRHPYFLPDGRHFIFPQAERPFRRLAGFTGDQANRGGTTRTGRIRPTGLADLLSKRRDDGPGF